MDTLLMGAVSGTGCCLAVSSANSGKGGIEARGMSSEILTTDVGGLALDLGIPLERSIHEGRRIQCERRADPEVIPAPIASSAAAATAVRSSGLASTPK